MDFSNLANLTVSPEFQFAPSHEKSRFNLGKETLDLAPVAQIALKGLTAMDISEMMRHSETRESGKEDVIEEVVYQIPQGAEIVITIQTNKKVKPSFKAKGPIQLVEQIPQT